jgi:hypothetical protein
MGGAGSDALFGSAGNDQIWGDAGNDWIFGGTGRDLLIGGDGSDFLDGGLYLRAVAGDGSRDTIFTDNEGYPATFDGQRDYVMTYYNHNPDEDWVGTNDDILNYQRDVDVLFDAQGSHFGRSTAEMQFRDYATVYGVPNSFYPYNPDFSDANLHIGSVSSGLSTGGVDFETRVTQNPEKSTGQFGLSLSDKIKVTPPITSDSALSATAALATHFPQTAGALVTTNDTFVTTTLPKDSLLTTAIAELPSAKLPTTSLLSNVTAGKLKGFSGDNWLG